MVGKEFQPHQDGPNPLRHDGTGSIMEQSSRSNSWSNAFSALEGTKEGVFIKERGDDKCPPKLMKNKSTGLGWGFIRLENKPLNTIKVNKK